MKRKHLLLIGFLLFSEFLFAQKVLKTAEKLKNNVVRIEANFITGTESESGFGFVIGEIDDTLFIATAKHVVYKKGSYLNPIAKVPSSIEVNFWSKGETPYMAYLMDGTTNKDIAILKVRKPFDYVWRKRSFEFKYKMQDDVVFIGKSNSWVIPQKPGNISSNDKKSAFCETINSEGLDISVGTSGSPLVSRKGIIGLITENSNDRTQEVVSIECFTELLIQLKGKESHRAKLYRNGAPVPLISVLLAGGGALAFWGIDSKNEGDDLYQTYSNNRLESSPIYNPSSSQYIGFDREALYEEANDKSVRGDWAMISGGIIFGLGTYFLIDKLVIGNRNKKYLNRFSFNSSIPNFTDGTYSMNLTFKF